VTLSAMPFKLLALLCFTLCLLHVTAQTPSTLVCGQHEYTEKLLQQYPDLRLTQQATEKAIAAWQKARKKTVTGTNPAPASPIILPVVVHIIHNNGPENISDLQVLTAIQHLNEAYANTGYYDPSDGVDTHIQFCMAQRDPDNNPTNGITRDVSVHTIMDQTAPINDDQNIKNIRRWNPLCYINIWIVASISPSIAGYANLPANHGSSTDGIVITASVFGTSYPNDIVVAHEMGHYLGLYHTFEGGCTNTDCSIDGDRVCDTPPDQSTVAIGCDQSVNSCHTDMLSGFTTDQNDLTKDYMDYGNYDCMKLFTQGQADRMNAAIQTALSSLLACKSCMEPCPAPVTVGFILPTNATEAGNSYTFGNTSTGAVSYEWYVNGALVSTATNLSYTFPATGSYTIRLLARTDNALCLDAEKTAFLYIPCPHGGCFSLPPGTPDSCAVNTFQKKFGGPLHDFAEDVLVDPDGNYLVTANVASYGAGLPDLGVMKFDPAGHVLWSKAFGDALANTGYCGTILNDGSSLHEGSAGSSGSIVYRLDKQGNVLWSRHYVGSSVSWTILATSDGGAVMGVDHFNTSTAIGQPGLIKIDASGNIEWSKFYFDYSIPLPRRIIEDGSQFVVMTDLGTTEFLVFAVDKTTGNLSWGKSYAVSGATDMRGNRILADGDRLLMGFAYTNMDVAGLLHAHYCFMSTDKQGIPQTTCSLDGVGLPSNSQVDLVLRKNGNIVLSYGPLSPTDPPNAALAELTPDGQLVRGLRYFTADAQSLLRIQNTPDGGIVGVGNAGVGIRPENAYILKTDSTLHFSSPSGGNGECTALEESPPISHPSLVVTDLPYQSVDATITVSDYTPTVTTYQLPFTDYCSNPVLCSDLHITGMDSVCVNDNDTLIYQGNKTPGCGLPIHWQLGSANATITGQTDSSVRLVFKDTGAITLYATLTAKCSILKDSLTLHAFRSPATIDLGGDLALCKQSTVQLNAGPGFKSYSWQDGSEETTFTAWLPGRYFVNAKDYCNNNYGDTIMITQAPDVPFDLGPDTAICRNDTLQITAPSGFINYSWTPNYQLDNPSLQTVQAAPEKDTTYLCTATKSRGCQVLDSIHIQVKELPQHFLSPSQPVCLSNQVQLQPIGQWIAYKWFNNSTAPTIIVNNPGTYKLEVTDANSCRGGDSITVIPGYCNPGIYFPNAFTPDNNGTNDFFRPIVTVPLDAFYMVIFNREGQKMFETKDYTHGWDGRSMGHKLYADSFVWYAQYHITGSSAPITIVKGFLTLVR
jgi:gliding motility-associated-like protein